jgi:short-subunit dehydrogenase involved in D-alanine esterification of teichoic acids
MQISTNRFAVQTVIATGAGSGIGRATERLTELTNELETDAPIREYIPIMVEREATADLRAQLGTLPLHKRMLTS